MELFFRSGKDELIFTSESVIEIFDYMDKYLENKGYHSYYKRYVGAQDFVGGILVDFGSCTEFFIVKGISFDEFFNQAKLIKRVI